MDCNACPSPVLNLTEEHCICNLVRNSFSLCLNITVKNYSKQHFTYRSKGITGMKATLLFSQRQHAGPLGGACSHQIRCVSWRPSSAPVTTACKMESRDAPLGQVHAIIMTPKAPSFEHSAWAMECCTRKPTELFPRIARHHPILLPPC